MSPTVKALVKVDILDTIPGKEGYPNSQICHIKVNVEGAEKDVLKSAQEALKKTMYIQVETFEHNPGNVVMHLKRHGFKPLVAIRHRGYRNIVFKRA